MKAGRGLFALIGVLAAGALLAPLARAGTYDVYSCQFGSSFYANNAWTANVAAAGGNAALFTTDTTCSKPGDVLAAAFQANVATRPARLPSSGSFRRPTPGSPTTRSVCGRSIRSPARRATRTRRS